MHYLHSQRRVSLVVRIGALLVVAGLLFAIGIWLALPLLIRPPLDSTTLPPGDAAQLAMQIESRIFIAMVVAAVAILLLLLLALRVIVLDPVIAVTRMVHGISETGNLLTRSKIERDDEIGDLAHAFDGLVALLHHRTTQLQSMAETDELTGLFNRRHINDALRSAVSRARRYGECFAVVMVDVDYFKDLNDSHGHQAGDEMLHAVAQAMKRTLRDTDMLGRYGGEEFLALLPHQGIAGAVRAAERLRSAVQELSVGSAKLKSTVSAGVAVLGADEDAEEILARADLNLYRAKRQGRNRVVA